MAALNNQSLKCHTRCPVMRADINDFNGAMPHAGAVGSRRMHMTMDPAIWRLGYDDGRAGRVWHPGSADRLAYASGYVEGKAARGYRS